MLLLLSSLQGNILVSSLRNSAQESLPGVPVESATSLAPALLYESQPLGVRSGNLNF